MVYILTIELLAIIKLILGQCILLINYKLCFMCVSVLTVFILCVPIQLAPGIEYLQRIYPDFVQIAEIPDMTVTAQVS